ncbi:hypothetical protein LWI28_006285 [Acer negundo]|uniref:Uncharacterized protein n=1 Tax=Acer negundo TaxID=4023 RepID=A0AAD5NQU4_ACENE|nr:hypothetical protein LWI28_006285 [Acer negundo]
MKLQILKRRQWRMRRRTAWVASNERVQWENELVEMIIGDMVSSKANQVEDVEEILPIPFGSAQVKDTVLWHFDEKGTYNVKSGYSVGQELKGIPSASNNWLWRGGGFAYGNWIFL